MVAETPSRLTSDSIVSVYLVSCSDIQKACVNKAGLEYRPNEK